MAQNQGRGNFSGGDRYENYVPVAERIEQFFSKFPDGKVLTTIIEHDREAGFVLVRAEVYRSSTDDQPAATGHAYEYKDAGFTQKTSYIEVGETSAVGRALAFLGFETKRGIASREEIEKLARSTNTEENAPSQTPPSPIQTSPPKKTSAQPSAATTPALPVVAAATEAQKKEILARLELLHPNDRSAQRKILEDSTGKRSRDDLTQDEARNFITELKKSGAA